MTVQEAATLLGKSVDTIYRWQRKGINVHDEAELLKHCERMAIQSKGKARTHNLRNIDAGKPIGPRSTAKLTLEQVETFLVALGQPVPLTSDELVQCKEGRSILPEAPISMEAALIFFKLGQSILRGIDVRLEQLTKAGAEARTEYRYLTGEREAIAKSLIEVGIRLEGYSDEGSLWYARSEAYSPDEIRLIAEPVARL